jgi:arginine/ornithine succinyltransferase subunit-like protein
MSEELVITPEADGQRLALADGIASLRFVPGLGLTLPRYHFHVGRVVHAAQELGLFRVQTTLLLGNDLTGQAELCDFQVSPAVSAPAQAQAWRRLLPAAVEHAARTSGDAATLLVAELPGWRDATGFSPFWQALGARFYRGDPVQAEQRFGQAWCSHLAALLPRQTIYLPFLGTAAEARLSQPADAIATLAQALADAGFEVSDHVRIDDGGPVLGRRLKGR